MTDQPCPATKYPELIMAIRRTAASGATIDKDAAAQLSATLRVAGLLDHANHLDVMRNAASNGTVRATQDILHWIADSIEAVAIKQVCRCGHPRYLHDGECGAQYSLPCYGAGDGAPFSATHACLCTGFVLAEIGTTQGDADASK